MYHHKCHKCERITRSLRDDELTNQQVAGNRNNEMSTIQFRAMRDLCWEFVRYRDRRRSAVVASRLRAHHAIRVEGERAMGRTPFRWRRGVYTILAHSTLVAACCRRLPVSYNISLEILSSNPGKETEQTEEREANAWEKEGRRIKRPNCFRIFYVTSNNARAPRALYDFFRQSTLAKFD